MKSIVAVLISAFVVCANAAGYGTHLNNGYGGKSGYYQNMPVYPQGSANYAADYYRQSAPAYPAYPAYSGKGYGSNVNMGYNQQSWTMPVAPQKFKGYGMSHGMSGYGSKGYGYGYAPVAVHHQGTGGSGFGIQSSKCCRL